jgi:hypothetical protein
MCNVLIINVLGVKNKYKKEVDSYESPLFLCEKLKNTEGVCFDIKID